MKLIVKSAWFEAYYIPRAPDTASSINHFVTKSKVAYFIPRAQTLETVLGTLNAGGTKWEEDLNR